MEADYSRKDAIADIMAGMPDAVVSLAFAFANAMNAYGVDITEKWNAATEQRDALNAAYTRGV